MFMVIVLHLPMLSRLCVKFTLARKLQNPQSCFIRKKKGKTTTHTDPHLLTHKRFKKDYFSLPTTFLLLRLSVLEAVPPPPTSHFLFESVLMPFGQAYT